MALECLEIISRSAILGNFYTVHNDWRNMWIGVDMIQAPVQVDANMGWTAVINEMLLYSKPGMMKLLPALPSRWKKGSVKGLLCRGAITLDLAWDIAGGSVRAELTPLTTQRVDIKLPFEIRSLTVNGEASDAISGCFIPQLMLEKDQT